MTNAQAGEPGGAALVISARGLQRRFGDNVVLAGIDVDVAHGVTGLLGSNGAGKTTFIELVLGLQRPNAGALSVLGADPRSNGPEIRARIGYAPEHHNLPPDVQAADLVRHLAQLHGLPRQAATERASDTLWLVGLGEERFRPIGTMSTGQRQRVKLAGAIAHDPKLVLLDEPTDGLDPVQRDEMLALIRKVGSEFGIDILLSSHLLEEVERICDSVVMIGGGRVLRSGRIDELSTDTAGLVVEVDDGADKLAAALRSVGWTVEQTGNRLVVSGPGPANDAVRDAIADRGLALRRLEPARHTLQDVFLEAEYG